MAQRLNSPLVTKPNSADAQIRDLEARVEILSGDKDERIELMLLLVRNLLQENKELRNMIKNMSSFFGEGESSRRAASRAAPSLPAHF